MQRYGKKQTNKDKQGGKKDQQFKKPKLDKSITFVITRSEELLEQVRQTRKDKRHKRQFDKQSVNWEAFGGDDKRLASSPLVPTKVRVIRKGHKRFSQK